MKLSYVFDGKDYSCEVITLDAITESGCVIKGAQVFVSSEDYTMAELVKAIKEAGYKYFMLPSMKRFAEVH